MDGPTRAYYLQFSTKKVKTVDRYILSHVAKASHTLIGENGKIVHDMNGSFDSQNVSSKWAPPIQILNFQYIKNNMKN